MRFPKSMVAIVVLMLTAMTSGSALAHHRDWHHRGHGAHAHKHYVAPRSHTDVYFGFSVGTPAYVYQPAPPVYYYPAPPHYSYYGPSGYYYDEGPASSTTFIYSD